MTHGNNPPIVDNAARAASPLFHVRYISRSPSSTIIAGVDATGLAETLLASVPANATLGVHVENAVDGDATVVLDVPNHLTNVVGSLHASGLVGLVDACGLAAIISALPDTDSVRNMLPLGRAAQLQFIAPARSALTARCELGQDARTELAAFVASGAKARFRAEVTIVNDSADTVCTGHFDWTVRRTD